MGAVHAHVQSDAAPLAELDDLLERSASGDMTAFAALYTETASRTFGLALRVLRDRGLAEEAVQEAYLTIWRTAGRFDPRRGSSLGWIFTIVHRSAVSHVRSADARSARDDRYHRGAASFALGEPDTDPTHHLAHASLEARLVRDAVSTLPDHQRQALRLAYFQGYTYNEVAGLLGIPLGTAKTHIRAGLTRLRQSLEIQAIRAARTER